MLKKRIIAAIPFIEGIAVQSIGFNRYMPIGKLEIAVEYLSRWGIDEIAVLDIQATRKSTGPNFEMIKKAAKYAQVPLAVGGGISSVEAVRKLLSSGADKVILNQAMYRNPLIVSEIAHVFGNQCLVGSIDLKMIGDQYFKYDYLKNQVNDCDWVSVMTKLTQLGVGEWLVNAVHCDGQYAGYDVKLVSTILRAVSVPVIPLGGYGQVNHLKELFETTNAQVAAIGNKLHFTEHSVTMIKSCLMDRDDIRLDTDYDYLSHQFDGQDRLIKLADEQLDDLLFEKIEEEVI